MPRLKDKNPNYRLSAARLLLQIRQKDTVLKRKHVARCIGISVNGLGNIEHGRSISADLMLRAFHYYTFIGRTTTAETRLFFYLLNHLCLH